MGTGTDINPVDLAFLSPDMVDEEQDPRRRLMSTLMGLSGTNPQGGSASTADMQKSDARMGEDADRFTPAGFSDSGIPNEFPATASKSAAKAKLDTYTKPQSGKQLLMKTLLSAVPALLAAKFGGSAQAAAGGARGALEGAQNAIQLRRQQMEDTQSQYQFEAGQEERQREAAIREKLAMSQLEANKAYRKLLIGVRERGQDITHEDRQTGQDISREKTNVGALEHGLQRNPNPEDGRGGFIPVTEDQLPLLAKQNLKVAIATENLKKAQATATPEMVEIRRKQVDVALQELGMRLQANDRANRTFGIDNYGIDPATGAPPPGQATINGEVVGRKNKAPTVVQDRSAQANVIIKSSKNLINSINTNKAVLGPVMGRYNSLKDFLGNPPPAYASIASELITYIALQPAAHGFRGLRAVAEFEKSIGTPIRTPEALIGAIQGNVRGIGPMSQAAGQTPGNANNSVPNLGVPTKNDHVVMRGGAGAGRSTLKKRSPENGAGNPPAGARIRDYTQIGAPQ